MLVRRRADQGGIERACIGQLASVGKRPCLGSELGLQSGGVLGHGIAQSDDPGTAVGLNPLGMQPSDLPASDDRQTNSATSAALLNHAVDPVMKANGNVCGRFVTCNPVNPGLGCAAPPDEQPSMLSNPRFEIPDPKS
jgi:hypothetical protein